MAFQICVLLLKCLSVKDRAVRIDRLRVLYPSRLKPFEEEPGKFIHPEFLRLSLVTQDLEYIYEATCLGFRAGAMRGGGARKPMEWPGSLKASRGTQQSLSVTDT